MYDKAHRRLCTTIVTTVLSNARDMWVPVPKAWRVVGLRMEERPSIWWVAGRILNKQSRTTDKEWFCSLEVGRDANNSSP